MLFMWPVGAADFFDEAHRPFQRGGGMAIRRLRHAPPGGSGGQAATAPGCGAGS